MMIQSIARLCCAMAASTALLSASAGEPVEGMAYFLPKTVVKVRLLVEKQTFVPGRLAAYSEKYLRTPNRMEASEQYRICKADFYAASVPDTARHYTVPLDKKRTIVAVECDDRGILLAVNDKGVRSLPPAPFVPARRAAKPQPDRFMTGDMLAAGAVPKLAELVAQEIMDIREARSMIQRGESEQMPKDGEQLRLMLQGLDEQEGAFLSLFEGTTTTDTLETVLEFTPKQGITRELLFRFSKWLGMLPADDPGGAPYYIDMEVSEDTAVPQIPTEEKKKREQAAFYIAQPVRVRLKLTDMRGQSMTEGETYVAQLGGVYGLSEELFSKKQITHLRLNPVTGVAEHIEIEPLK